MVTRLQCNTAGRLIRQSVRHRSAGAKQKALCIDGSHVSLAQNVRWIHGKDAAIAEAKSSLAQPSVSARPGRGVLFHGQELQRGPSAALRACRALRRALSALANGFDVQVLDYTSFSGHLAKRLKAF